MVSSLLFGKFEANRSSSFLKKIRFLEVYVFGVFWIARVLLNIRLVWHFLVIWDRVFLHSSPRTSLEIVFPPTFAGIPAKFTEYEEMFFFFECENSKKKHFDVLVHNFLGVYCFQMKTLQNDVTQRHTTFWGEKNVKFKKKIIWPLAPRPVLVGMYHGAITCSRGVSKLKRTGNQHTFGRNHKRTHLNEAKPSFWTLNSCLAAVTKPGKTAMS